MAILSIQSHVVYGYVGNTAATFPLQFLGHDVWALNTVEFSNHTGYGAWRGQVLSADLILDLVQGLVDRQVLDQGEALLTGYLGSPEIGQAILEALQKLRSVRPGALYCCDPVMGDYGRGFFVHPGIPELFRKQIVPHADLVTPNHFELEALTGITIRSSQDTRRALEKLHQAGPRIVLVTSFRENGEDADRIDMLASDGDRVFQITTPKIPLLPPPNGGGDLTASLFLSHYLETQDIQRALEATTASVYGILQKTGEKNSRELQIVGARMELIHPSHTFTARRL
jgi:pyridoxine kinase